MTTNITLRLDEALLQKARHIAVDRRLSVSAWVAEVVAQAVDQQAEMSARKKTALRFLDQPFDIEDGPLSREQVYERQSIR
ncbi:MAG: DUF6364 family protein [Panacagrimonas sp.]